MTETSEAGAHRRLGAVRGRVTAARRAFRRWRRRRPFWGGLLLMLSGLQIFASTQLSLGNIQMRIGLEGMQSIVIPIVVGLAGLLIWFMPAHRVFYGVIGIVVALYSLIGVNLGGFLIGMLLGILGGSFAIAWAPNPVDESPAHGDDDHSDEPEADDDPDDIVAIDDLMEDDYPVRPDRRTDREGGRASVQILVVGGLLAALIASEWVVPAVAGPSVHVSTADVSCEEPDVNPVARIAGVIGDVVDGILPGDEASPSPSATSTPEPTPTVTATPPPSPTPDPTSAPSPTSTPSPTSEPSPEPSPEPEPCEPPAEGPPPEDEPPSDNEAPSDEGEANEDETGESDWPLPKSEWPDGAEPTEVQVLAAPDDLIVGNPSRLTADQLTMYGLRYEGNVCLPQVDGSCIEVMHFMMDKATMVNAKLDSPGYEDGRLVTDMGDLELDGNIHFYTPRFVGWLLGFKWTFLPETPPPFTLPIMPFSDVDIQMAAVITDVMKIAGMQQQPGH